MVSQVFLVFWSLLTPLEPDPPPPDGCGFGLVSLGCLGRGRTGEKDGGLVPPWALFWLLEDMATVMICDICVVCVKRSVRYA